MLDFTKQLVDMGLKENTIFLLLALPFISFLIGLFRHVIGIKTFGMYEPIVISFALYAMSPIFGSGLKYGLPILFIAWLVGEVTRRILKNARLHYISKVSLKISIASIFMLCLLVLAALFNKTGYFDISPLSVVIILALVESISLFQVKKGDFYTNLLSIETLFVSVFSYFIITNQTFSHFLLERPYFVLLPIFANFIVGRWTGFRLSEYIRFKNIMKND